jgi:hypothetical protein
MVCCQSCSPYHDLGGLTMETGTIKSSIIEETTTKFGGPRLRGGMNHIKLNVEGFVFN